MVLAVYYLQILAEGNHGYLQTSVKLYPSKTKNSL